MIARHGKGQPVELYSEGRHYLDICAGPEKARAASIKTDLRLQSLEQERVWYNLFLQSLLLLPGLGIIAWLGVQVKFFPVRFMLLSIAPAVGVALLVTTLLGLAHKGDFPDVLENESLRPGKFGIFAYLWECLAWAGILTALTLPALLNRFQTITLRPWLRWLTFLLLPGSLVFLIIQHNIGRVAFPLQATHQVLNYYGLISGVLYVGLLIAFLWKGRRKVVRERLL